MVYSVGAESKPFQKNQSLWQDGHLRKEDIAAYTSSAEMLPAKWSNSVSGMNFHSIGLGIALQESFVLHLHVIAGISSSPENDHFLQVFCPRTPQQPKANQPVFEEWRMLRVVWGL